MGISNNKVDGLTFYFLTNGEELSYTNWETNEPDGNVYNCVHKRQTSGGPWMDKDCTDYMPCHCEARLDSDIDIFASIAHYAKLENIEAEFWTKWMEIEIEAEDIETCSAQCHIRNQCWSFAYVSSKKLCYIGDVRMKKKIKMRTKWISNELATVYTKAGEDIDLTQKNIIQR